MNELLLDYSPVEGLAVPTAPGISTLRDYQIEAVAAIIADWSAGRDTVLVLPTSTGKTEVFIGAMRKWLNRYPGMRAMMLADRIELIDQSADRIADALGEPVSIEMANRYASNGELTRRVVVTSVQTQTAGKPGAERMREFNPHEFGLLVIDETHHAPTFSFGKVIRHYRQNPRLRLLGVTATPFRKDKKSLGKWFNSYAMVRTLPWAIAEGWVVPLRYRPARVLGLSYDGIKVREGDFSASELDRVLQEEHNVQGMAKPIHELMNWEQAIVFCAGRKQARSMCSVLNRRAPGSARVVLCSTPKEERRQLIADFRAARFPYLVNVGVITEGFDVPNIRGVVMCRPTMSLGLYLQMLGRGGRTLPGTVDGHDTPEARRAAIAASPKPSVLVIDFVSNTTQHALIGIADVLGYGCSGPDTEVIKRKVRAKLENAGREGTDEDVDPQQLWEEAAKEEEARRAGIIATVDYETGDYDPLIHAPVIEPIQAGAMIRPDQVAILKLWKFDGIDGMTAAAASQLIARERARRKAGLASHAMVQQLKKRGVADADRWTSERAEVAKRILIGLNWRPRGEWLKKLLNDAGVLVAEGT